MKRAIVLFPRFDNAQAIQRIREQYDPLANYIAPHMTLVFPFESDLSTDDVRAHISQALKGVKKFTVQLNGITGDFRDGYLFLNVKQGNDNIIELHDKLYSGSLEQFLFRKVTYCPHLTLGRVEQQSAFDQALKELGSFAERFETETDKISVECIDEAEHSLVEQVFDLE